MNHANFAFEYNVTLANLSNHLTLVLPLGIFDLLDVLSIHLRLMLDFSHTLVHMINFVVRIRSLLKHLPDEPFNETNYAFASRPHGRWNIVPVIINNQSSSIVEVALDLLPLSFFFT